MSQPDGSGDGPFPGGGGGGGGGWNGNGAGAAAISNASPLAGGTGGNGGDSNPLMGGGGGGGGAGGYGAVVTGGTSSSNTSTITGGAGGAGGVGINDSANGGDGGVGTQFTASSASFTNTGSGTISGGVGGNGGAGYTDSGNVHPGPAGAGGGGGAGVSFAASATSVTNSGSIAGGMGGTGGTASTGVGPAGAGAGGGGGAGVSFAASATSVTNSGTITGGTGGNAGGGNAGRGGGGGGGIVGSGLAITNSGTIAGGPGGNGGSGIGNTGGSGGGGIVGNGLTITNSGIITGGPGGDTSGLLPGGGGGAGIVGSGLAITNSGAIIGGFAAFAPMGSNPQANAITFTGGANSLTLLAGSTISGNIDVTGSLTISPSTGVASTLTVTGTGSVIKTGAGTLTLTGNNTYSGSTTVNAGVLELGANNALPTTGALTVNGGTFGLHGFSQTVGDLSGTGGLIVIGTGTLTAGGSGNTTLATPFTGSGGLIKQGTGTLTLTGASTIAGSSTGVQVLNGTLSVLGSLTSNVSVRAAGTLGGTGTITGGVDISGRLTPGNGIGTLTINGTYSQNTGTYQVAVNSAGQSSLASASGGAAIFGGTVTATALSGSYGSSTKYTIFSATGGLSGTFSSVSLTGSSLLTPSLSYDSTNAYLTLTVNPGAFSGAGSSTNQRSVGAAFDRSFANAGGDFGTVVGNLFGLTPEQFPAAYDALSGQPIANFGTMNVQGAALFMNALGQQMAAARGSAASAGQRVALAQACEIATCEAASPFNVWGSLLGGLGSVQGDGNASTLTYNFGGAAAGIDYRIDPRFLVGIGAGYLHGTQWVNNFLGQGWTDSVSIAAYGSFTQSGFYADVLAGYAYYGNQIQRQIVLPGLQPRTTTGSTGANQFLGQIETGYQVPIHAPTRASLTPFARLQGSTVTQNGFNEGGAQSLSLNVQQQTTNSLRTLFGVDLAGSVPLGSQRQLDLALRLGWQHEFADTTRPITAAFTGAPFAGFTVYGATPQRDSAVIGFSARTNIAAATQLYLRYDGEIASGTDNHALNVGVRVSW